MMRKRLITKTTGVSKEILKYLFLVGAIYIAASSPYFIFYLMKNISELKNSKKRKITNAFSYLRRRGFIEIRKEKHDIRIALTEEGEKRAGKYQIDDLEIKNPKKWDRKWRVVIFDIPHEERIKRNAFRRKLKELGFYSLQKSVWVHPYQCKEEIGLLREFFGSGKKQIQILVAEKIENDSYLREFFGL